VLAVPAALVLVSLAVNHPKLAAQTPRTAEAASAPHGPRAAAPQWDWKYRDWRDGMGRRHWMATVASANTLEFGFPYAGRQHASLCIRSQHQDLLEDVFLTIERGQFLCGLRGCSVNVKFDDQPIRSFDAVEAEDHSTTVLFLQEPAAFIAQLRKAKRVRIEALFFREGMRTADFRTAGFEW
jgi:hypothetical protein